MANRTLGQPLSNVHQRELRAWIEHEGLERVAARLGVTTYLAARAAAGATMHPGSCLLVHAGLERRRAA